MTVAPLLQATRKVPIVFVQVADPVGAGFVDSLARPGGNATGFSGFEYGLGGKWLELLKQVAPRVARVTVLRDSTAAAGIGQFAAIQTVTPMGIELSVLHQGSQDSRSQNLFGLAPNCFLNSAHRLCRI